MSAHPMIDALLAECDEHPEWNFISRHGPFIRAVDVKNATLATELRALLAEREKLADENETLRNWLPTPPTRKLREYKGVTYEDGAFRVVLGGNKWAFQTVAALIAGFPNSFTDADHAPIYALKDDPYEPVETVEDVLHEMYNALGASEIILPEYHEEVITRLRAAFAAENNT